MFRALSALFAAVALFAAPGAWAQAIQLIPDFDETCGGQQVVAVRLSDSVNLSGFQFEILFDTTQYDFISVAKGADNQDWVLLSANEPGRTLDCCWHAIDGHAPEWSRRSGAADLSKSLWRGDLRD
jgi:hypothetical protein